MREKPLILVVDDDQYIRQIVKVFLKKGGYEVAEAKNGLEAYEIAKKQHPDLILLDVMMPVMDGFNACKKIKMEEDLKEIPIVMLTALHRTEDIMAAIQAGANDYIAKPFKKETIIAKTERFLRPPVAVPVETGVEKRIVERKPIPFDLSWGVRRIYGLAPAFKTKVINISPNGLAFEFTRCETCTGYEKGKVHPNCLFAKYGLYIEDSIPLDFIISYKEQILIEIKGKVVHVYQPEDNPKVETVGVKFYNITAHEKREVENLIQSIK